MKRQIVAAPMRLIAIGRKMMVLATFSPVGFSRSVSVATVRPMVTVTAGTMMIHSTVLISVCWNSLDLNSVVKLLKPTQFWEMGPRKLLMMVSTAG